MWSINSKRNLNVVDLMASKIIYIQHLTTWQEVFRDPAVQKKRGSQIIHCVFQAIQLHLKKYTIQRWLVLFDLKYYSAVNPGSLSWFEIDTQLIFTCSTSTIKALEKGVNRRQWCFHCKLWTYFSRLWKRALNYTVDI